MDCSLHNRRCFTPSDDAPKEAPWLMLKRVWDHYNKKARMNKKPSKQMRNVSPIAHQSPVDKKRMLSRFSEHMLGTGPMV